MDLMELKNWLKQKNLRDLVSEIKAINLDRSEAESCLRFEDDEEQKKIWKNEIKECKIILRELRKEIKKRDLKIYQKLFCCEKCSRKLPLDTPFSVCSDCLGKR